MNKLVRAPKGTVLPPAKPVPWKPHAYQLRCIKFGVQQGAAAFLLDPGLGKTSIALAIHMILKKQGIIERSLCVAPIRPMRITWPDELAKWSDFAGVKYRILHGPKKDKILEEVNNDPSIDFVLINPDGLDWFTDENYKGVVPYKEVGADCLFVDEMTKFKNTRTQRFKFIKSILSTFKRRYGLTGSPVANGYMDLFGQMYLLDLGNALGRYITHYRQEYFYPTGYNGYDWQLQDGAEKRILARIKPLSIRMDADDYLKLPELITNDIYVDLPSEARKAYDEMEEQMFTELDTGTATSSTMASVSMKCRQIANGSIYLDGPMSTRKAGWVHGEKVKALVDLIEQLQGSPLLVAYQFDHDMDAIWEALSYDWNMVRPTEQFPIMGKGISAERERQLEKLWNLGKLPYMFGQSSAISHGLNLQQNAFHVCWFGLTWNLEDYDQLIRRVRRQGNKAKTVFNHRLLARNTIDSPMAGTLGGKAKMQNAMLQALKTYRKIKLK